MRQKTNLKYYYFFSKQSIKEFNKLFPRWKDVDLPPMERALADLFDTPVTIHDEFMNNLTEISQEFSFWNINKLKPMIKTVIEKIAIAHDKTYGDWEKTMIRVKTFRVSHDFLAKYPDWEDALPPALKKIIEMLYGLDESGKVYSLAHTGKILGGFSRQVIQGKRDSAFRLLDLYHGYNKQDADSIQKRVEFAQKLIAFRKGRKLAEMAKYFGIRYGVYWKLENRELRKIPDEYYRICAEALKD
jgi:hypothetical protein